MDLMGDLEQSGTPGGNVVPGLWRIERPLMAGIAPRLVDHGLLGMCVGMTFLVS